MPNKDLPLKIFIITGEVSGDVLGAKIIAELKNNNIDIEFSGIGGENMKAAGVDSIFPISDLAVMGLFEVIAKIRTITSRINQTVDAIIDFKPDIVLTIDSPSFAKQVIKKIRKEDSSIKFFHVVAPQVWAWGAARAKKYAKLFDRLYCFFDFEKPYFEKYGLKTVAVGHPIAQGLNPTERVYNHLSPNIALIPGSRMSEVKKLLPVLKASAEDMCKINSDSVWYNFYIPTVETTKKYIEQQIASWCVKPVLIPSNERYELYKKMDFAIAASGTVTVELAIMHIPTIVIYKMNPITTWLARRLVKVKWVSLVNILLNKKVYPELLGNDMATPENIVKEFISLTDENARNKMISDLKTADKMWHRSNPAVYLIAKDLIENMK